MDNRLRHLLIGFCIVFVILSINLTYLQFFASDKLVASQYNVRSLAQELAKQRGSVITSDGIEIAKSEHVPDTNKYQRFFPQGEAFASVTGFYDSRYGRFALEQTYNDQLLGKDSADSFADYIDRIEGRDQPGNDLILTIDSKVQRTAYQNLIGYRGAAVAIDPNTGAVKALVSYPGYNPNTVRNNWKQIINDKDSPMLNRAISGLYPPGSSFKTITLAAAFSDGKIKPTKIYPAPPTLPVFGSKVTNYKSKNWGRLSVQKAFAESVNTVFAQIGLDVGAAALVEQAQSFGFNKELDFDLKVKNSVISSAGNMDKVDVAWTAVGQGETLATPMQMALVSAAVANKGMLMKPYLVNKVRDYQGKVVEKAKTQEDRTMSAKTAAILKDLMIQVVEDGTGAGGKVPGVTVAGKTGTAEVQGKRPHAWFIAFAPANKPKIAVAVIVENAGTGGAKAAPIAREIIKTALRQHK